MIHIVFQPADAERIKEAIALDDKLEGQILVIKDDLSLGKLADALGNESFQDRKLWWEEVLQYSPYIEQNCLADDRLTMHQLKKKLDESESEKVWIWMAQNAHDVCGYFWLIAQLKKYQGRIFILFLNNLPFINEKGSLFYPDYIFEIKPTEFLKAKKLARPVTISEFEIDGDEYKKLCTLNSAIRLLEGGKKIVGKEPDCFDEDLQKLINDNPQKLMKIINTFGSKNRAYISDVFIAWRIRKLAEEGKVEVTGNWENGWKEINVNTLEKSEKITE